MDWREIQDLIKLKHRQLVKANSSYEFTREYDQGNNPDKENRSVEHSEQVHLVVFQDRPVEENDLNLNM